MGSDRAPLLTLHNAVLTRPGRGEVLRVPYLDVREGEVLALIGPNGAGKTTLVLALAALLPLAQGELRYRDQRVDPRRSLAYRRRIAVVMQEPLLLRGTVWENVALGLTLRGLPKATIAARVEQALQQLGIADLAQRPARRLSGGEARRVSLARALAVAPDILFLDEPLTALDTPTRRQLLEDLGALFRRRAWSAVYVTHDFNEALALADRIAVVMDGQVRQVGPPEEVFRAPLDVDVARFVGVETVLAGRVIHEEDGFVRVDVGPWTVEAVAQARVGQEVYVCLRPEHITLWPPETSIPRSSARNRVVGRVRRVIPLGPVVKVVVDSHGLALIAQITRTSAQALGLHEGQEVALTFKASAAHIIPREARPIHPQP